MANEFTIPETLIVGSKAAFGELERQTVSIANEIEAVNDTGNASIGIFTGAASVGAYNFGTGVTVNSANIDYNHSTTLMRFVIGGTPELSIDASGGTTVTTFAADLTVGGAAVITDTVIVGNGAAFGEIGRLPASIANEIEAVSNSGNASIGIFTGASSVGAYNFGTGVTAASANIEYDHDVTQMRFKIGGAAELIIDASLATTVTTIIADMVIDGNLTVSGTTTTVNSANLNITDNIILLNKDEVGAGVTLGAAGVEIERGSLTNAGWFYNEAQDWWGPSGPAGSLVPGVGTTQTIGNVAAIDPTLITDEVLTINGIGAIKIPAGNTAARPSSPVNGMVRYSSTFNNLEGYINGNWEQLLNTGSSITISGDLTMDTGAQFFIDNGTTLDPGLAFANDTDTGIFLSGTNSIGFTAGNSELLRVGPTEIDAFANLDMNGNILFGPLDPVLGTQVGDRDFNDARYINTAGDTMAGTLNINNNALTNPLDPVDATGVGDRGFNDARYLLESNNLSDLTNVATAVTNLGLSAGGSGDIWVEKAGDTMTGDLVMNGADIEPGTDNTQNVGTVSKKFLAMYATTFNGTATSALYSDLAERYAADMELESGTVVVFGGEAEITKSFLMEDTAVAGVISTTPAFRMNSEAGENKTHPYIALKGRVPCKVTGPIKKGDLLVTATLHGHAMSAGKRAGPYTAFARALENFSGGTGVIEVAII